MGLEGVSSEWGGCLRRQYESLPGYPRSQDVHQNVPLGVVQFFL